MLRVCRIVILISALLSSAAGDVAQAQEAREYIGRGIHAFYSGNYRQAQSFLETAIGAGSRNPVAYYFRGLSLARLGMSELAETDYQIGATLEFRSLGRYDVGFALQRVQGPDRIRLERVRNLTRKAYQQQRQARARQAPQTRASKETRRKPSPPQDNRYRWLTVTPTPSGSQPSFESLQTNYTPIIPDNLEPDPNDPFANAEANLPIGATGIQPARTSPDKFVSSQPNGAAADQSNASQAMQDSSFPPAAETTGPKRSATMREGGLVGSILGAIAGGDDSTDPFTDDPESEADTDLFGSMKETPSAGDEADSGKDAETGEEDDDLFDDLF